MRFAKVDEKPDVIGQSACCLRWKQTSIAKAKVSQKVSQSISTPPRIVRVHW